MPLKPPLRLAMFGPICHTGGSSAMALFGVVEEWLRAGHEIDFYSPGAFIDPERLVSWDTFRYTSRRSRPVEVPRADGLRAPSLASQRRAPRRDPRGPLERAATRSSASLTRPTSSPASARSTRAARTTPSSR